MKRKGLIFGDMFLVLSASGWFYHFIFALAGAWIDTINKLALETSSQATGRQ